MKRLTEISKKIISTSLSLSLALCLIFSSLSVYTSEIFFTDDSNESSISVIYLKQGFIHHINVPKNTFLAELIDTEEKDDDNTHKNNSKLTLKLLRTLWSYSSIEANNHTTVEFTEIPILKIAVPCYIEYCSLKIPSLV